MQKISESVEGCAGCVHLYQVKASRLGTSSDGPGCRLYGGHAIARCTSFVELKTHRKLYEIQGVSKSEGEGVPSDFVAQLCAELGVEGGERTILAEIAKLKAKIDDRVTWDKRLKDGTATCKGFMRFFTGCGQCVRCKEEVHALLTKNAELENERNTLRARVDTTAKALANAQFCVEECAADIRKIAGLT